MELSLGRKLLFSAIVLVLVSALLEGGARLLYKPDLDTVYDEHQKIIDVLGLPELNETMVFDPVLFWKLKPGLDGRRVRGRVKEQPVDFAVTTNSLGLRSPAPGREGTQFRVLAVGNSCTFGLGVDNEETWPSRLEEELNRTLDGVAEVVNAGVPGYTSYQGRKYLETAGLDLDPDLVIITFGFNDSEVWSSRTDVQTGRLLQMQQLGSALGRSRFYQALARLLKGRDDAAVPLTIPEGERGKQARVSPDEFRANMKAMKEMCAARHVPVIFLVWPYRNQVRDENLELIVYQPGIAMAGEETATPVISLIEPFLASEEEPFLDHVHATPAGCRMVAEAIASILEQARVR